MKLVLLIALCFPLMGLCQADSGIHFTKGLNLKEIMELAASENKYIFIDCYASWCGPCKVMERDIYPLKRVGDLVNQNFISIKMQFDSTSKDSDEIKKLYKDAKEINNKYGLTGYPTYLFFSPAGKIVHRNIGAWDEEGFISIISDALDPEKEIYISLGNYEQGKMEYSELPKLARKTRKLGIGTYPDKIDRDFIINYLDKLSTDSMYNSTNLNFIASSDLIPANSKIFNSIDANDKYIDSVAQRIGFAKMLKKNIIFNSELLSLVQNAEEANKTPDWVIESQILTTKYGKTVSDAVITDAKILWYKKIGDWKRYVVCLVHQTDLLDSNSYQMNDFVFLNSVAMDIFTYSNNSKELNKGLELADRAIGMTPQDLKAAVMDTKANLLYKLGRIDDAIEEETKAVALYPDFKTNLETMKQGLPTWN